jgi:hypothetical protein
MKRKERQFNTERAASRWASAMELHGWVVIGFYYEPISGDWVVALTRRKELAVR